MRKWICVGLVLFITTICMAENFLLNGNQKSHVRYTMEQEIQPAKGTKRLVLSYVTPQTFTSPSYSQSIQSFHIKFSEEPYKTEKKVDERGNEIITASWWRPKQSIKATITINMKNRTFLHSIETEAPFPLTNLPRDVKMYLASTKQAPSDNPLIKRKAKELTADATSEFDAVQQILAWIVDHVNYVQPPKSYDALYSFRRGKGNCQNYSHLAAALMRAVGIPVRIVNGVTLKKSTHIKLKYGTLTMRMAEGRHSWVEIYFADLGWIPFDPQQMQLFVSNRFLRVEVGLDNNETMNDGSVRWTQYRGYYDKPRFREKINADFIDDKVELAAERQTYGPRKLLLTPPVQMQFAELFYHEAAEVPVMISSEALKGFDYSEPFEFGNLEFPQDVDFLDTRSQVENIDDTVMIMRKNFLVETAEYVTTKGQKYAQTFILNDPVQLEKIGLALHKFGGEGQLWIEILKDDGSGKPGEHLTSSDILPLPDIKYFPGYEWIDFPFDGDPVQLSPGRYWIALGYTGSPVINWFFTYGKPVGPSDGTRYKTMFDEDWSRSLTYEFNYRIIGKIGK